VFTNLQTFLGEERLEIQESPLDGIRIQCFSLDSSQTSNEEPLRWNGKENPVRVRKFGESKR
jgi:hypothetical protein